jgi:hypothetical protein
MNNKFYDILKYIVTIVIPAVCTLFGTLSQIWGMDAKLSMDIVSSITAIDLCIGIIMGISTHLYNKELKLDINDFAQENIQDTMAPLKLEEVEVK